MTDSDSYTIAVCFTRSLSADVEITGDATPQALIAQFVRELQEVAFEQGNVDGQFQVEAIRIGNKTTVIA